MDSEAKHLRQDPGYTVGHDRRPVGDLIQQLDDFARLDRARVAAAPARQHIRIEDSLHVFRPPALALDMPCHKFVGQVLDRMPRRAALGWLVRFYARRNRDSGAPRVDTSAEEGARSLGLLVRSGEAGFRPHPEHEAGTLAMPVEAPMPGLRSSV